MRENLQIVSEKEMKWSQVDRRNFGGNVYNVNRQYPVY